VIRRGAPAISVEDLRAYAHPNPEPFVAILEKMKERGKPTAMSWSWVAFLVPLPWFAYRKLWGALIVLPVGIAVIVLLNLYVPQLGHGPRADGFYIVLAVVMGGMYGRAYLVQTADKTAAKATERGLAGEARAAYLAKRGGTSPLAAALVGIAFGILVALYVLAIVGLILLHK
jgi:hypothetical protein